MRERATSLASLASLASFVGLVSLVGFGCSTEATTPATASGDVPTTYDFAGRFGAAGVSYPGQVHRHVLISDLSAWIGGLTTTIDGGEALKAGDVEAGCDFYYAYNAAVGADVAIRLTTEPAALQTTLGDLSSKSLHDKFAGNDPIGQHKDWNQAFVGWAGQPSAQGLLRSWFKTLDQAAVDRVAGQVGTAPDGSKLKVVYVSADGRDYRQLIAKLLGVGVSFSQGVDDYLDDDVADKGLRSSHIKPEDDGDASTELAHAWDEAFGYFGAARDYGDYSDAEIAGKGGRDGWKTGAHDTNGDGKIDLTTERNFGHATNAAKRDLGAKALAPTDFTAAAFDAFLAGRHLLATTTTTLTATQFATLQGYRDTIVQAWERAIAATLVHYLNAVLRDMKRFGTPDYDFYAHAKDWSELKGFALGLQFNRRSPLTAAQFAELHTLLGDSPTLPTAPAATITAYAAGLRQARTLLVAAYDFDAKLLGDAGGVGGL